MTVALRRLTTKLTGSRWMGGGSPAARAYVERAARVGLTAKGLLYLLLGVVTAQLGLGLPDTVASRQGAFATLAAQPFGAGLLLLLALGLGSYALWRA